MIDTHVRGLHGRDQMIVGFTSTLAISVYHHLRCVKHQKPKPKRQETKKYPTFCSDANRHAT